MEKAQEEGSGFKCDECQKICKSPETYKKDSPELGCYWKWRVWKIK